MKILNLIQDEKFTDGLIQTLDVLGVDADYVWLVRDVSAYKYTKVVTARLRQVIINSPDYQDLLRTDVYDYVMVHYADGEKIDFVVSYTGRAKIFWSTWGADYCVWLNDDFYEKETRRHYLCDLVRRSGIKGRCSHSLRNILGSWHLHKVLLSKKIKSFLAKIDFFSCVLPTEETLLRRLVGSRPRYLQFHYLSQLTFESQPKNDFSCDEIVAWCGNSATYSNNTFDVVDLLAQLEPCDVYVPLSYGADVEDIDEYGKRILAERWHPLKDFLPLAEYRQILQRCNIFFFNHRRQQAIGNVIFALMSGGCVVLNRHSPAVKYYRDLGVTIYTFDDLRGGIRPLLQRHVAIAQQNADRVFRSRQGFADHLRETFKYLADAARLCKESK